MSADYQTVNIRQKINLGDEFYSSAAPAVSCTRKQLKQILEFNTRVANRSIEFESVVCLCGCQSFDLIASVDRYGFIQDTVKCVECGLLQSNPRMTSQAYADFYTSDLYRLCYEGEDYLHKGARRYNLEYGQHIFKEIIKVKPINVKISVLEVGAGGGWNLLPFMHAGAKVLGVDQSTGLTQLGIRQGIPMKTGTLEDIGGQFDVIILNHVLEHFLNPLESLFKLATRLKAGGIIYIAVPNILNFDITQLQNAHTYYFTPDTLELYCNRAGFRLLSMGRAEKIHLFGIFRPEPGGKIPVSKRSKKELNFRRIKLKQRLKRLLKVAMFKKLTAKILSA